jgi:transcription elongation factor Elf1
MIVEYVCKKCGESKEFYVDEVEKTPFLIIICKNCHKGIKVKVEEQYDEMD